MTDYPCGKFGDCSVTFWFCHACGQTHTHTDRCGWTLYSCDSHRLAWVTRCSATAEKPSVIPCRTGNLISLKVGLWSRYTIMYILDINFILNIHIHIHIKFKTRVKKLIAVLINFLVVLCSNIVLTSLYYLQVMVRYITLNIHSRSDSVENKSVQEFLTNNN